MKRFALCTGILLLILTATGVFARDFQLVFLDGSAELREEGVWVPLVAGDTVVAGSSIRIPNGSIAEFTGPQETLLFSSPGTYRLDSASGSPAREQSSAVSSIFNRLSKVGSETVPERSEVMGVRGSEAVESEGFTWMDEDSLNFEEAEQSFADGDYESVLDILEHEVDPVVLEDPGAYWYYLAASYHSLGRTGPAIKILLKHDVESFSSAYRDYLFLRGRLAFEGRNYEEAETALVAYLGEEQHPEKRQLAYYLLGVSHLEQGKTGEGKIALEEAIAINANGEITVLARRMLR